MSQRLTTLPRWMSGLRDCGPGFRVRRRLWLIFNLVLPGSKIRMNQGGGRTTSKDARSPADRVGCDQVLETGQIVCHMTCGHLTKAFWAAPPRPSSEEILSSEAELGALCHHMCQCVHQGRLGLLPCHGEGKQALASTVTVKAMPTR